MADILQVALYSVHFVFKTIHYFCRLLFLLFTFYLFTHLLFFFLSLQPEFSAPGEDWYVIGDKLVNASYGGSSDFVHISIYPGKHLKELREAKQNNSYSSSKFSDIKMMSFDYPESDNEDPQNLILPPMGDGQFIIGQYDLDPEIEMMTFEGNLEKFNVLTRPFAISPDGQMRMEDGLIAQCLMFWHAHLSSWGHVLFLMFIVIPGCSILWLVWWLYWVSAGKELQAYLYPLPDGSGSSI